MMMDSVNTSEAADTAIDVPSSSATESALPPEELEGVPTVCASLREACEALDADRDFLKKGGVFNDSLIDGYLDLKMEEVVGFETAPHPIEYAMYYSV